MVIAESLWAYITIINQKEERDAREPRYPLDNIDNKGGAHHIAHPGTEVGCHENQ